MKQDIKDADAVISLLDPVKNQRDPTHRDFHFLKLCPEMSEFSRSIWSLQEFVSVLSFMTNI